MVLGTGYWVLGNRYKVPSTEYNCTYVLTYILYILYIPCISLHILAYCTRYILYMPTVPTVPTIPIIRIVTYTVLKLVHTYIHAVLSSLLIFVTGLFSVMWPKSCLLLGWALSFC